MNYELCGVHLEDRATVLGDRIKALRAHCKGTGDWANMPGPGTVAEDFEFYDPRTGKRVDMVITGIITSGDITLMDKESFESLRHPE